MLEELAFGSFVRGLKAAEELERGIDDLLGELGGDGGLIVAAALEQRGEASLGGA